MRKIVLLFVTLFTFSKQATFGQIKVNLKNTSLVVKKIDSTDLVIPLEMEFINKDSIGHTPQINIIIDSLSAVPIYQLTGSQPAQVEIINNGQVIPLNGYESKKAPNTFYLLIDKYFTATYDRIINLRILNRGTELTSIKVTIQQEDKVLSLTDYMEKNNRKNRVNRLDEVTKVESSNTTMIISGYKEIISPNKDTADVFLKRTVNLEKGEVFSLYEPSWIFQRHHWYPVPISLITVPVKVRPKITSNDKVFYGSSNAGITNIGLNLDLIKTEWEKYFSNGKKSTHKFSLGFWAAPSVEEIDSVYTHGADGKLGKAKGKLEKSKQLFISTGFTISYTYNDISFVFVPVGFDSATSPIGRTWIYNNKRWWGFGIAVSPKIFGAILNK